MPRFFTKTKAEAPRPSPARRFTVLPSHERGMVHLDFPYDEKVLVYMKVRPGMRWNPEIKKWVGPEECMSTYRWIAEHTGYEFVDSTVEPSLPLHGEVNPSLHGYQKDAVLRALRQRSLLISFEQGLGKTATAIETIRLSGAKRALIVCPAAVRNTWKEELETWWPKHPPVAVVEDGQPWTNQAASIVITSYELMHAVPRQGFDVLVMDESHYIANTSPKGGAKRAALAVQFGEANPGAIRLALSGTPINTELDQLFGQLAWLWPGNGKSTRFGTEWQFKGAYMGQRENPYRKMGFDYVGVNEGRLPELNERLTACIVRVTTADVQGLVKPLHCHTIRLQPKAIDLNTLLARMDYEGIVEAHGSGKVGEVVRRAIGDTLAGGHVIVLTHTKATAERVAKALEEAACPYVHVSGDVPVKQRHKRLQDGLATKRCVFVTTMHAIKEGINFLADIPTVYFIEYYWSPGVISQVMKRFNRLNSKGEATVNFLIFRGSYEENVVAKLRQRMADVNGVYNLTDTELATVEALDDHDDDKLTFLEQVTEAGGDETILDDEEWTL